MSYKLNDNVEVYTTDEADERFSAGNVAVEKERAEAAEAALDTKIDNEITRATAAEGTNAGNIAQNTSDIASLSGTVSGFSTDIAANTAAITAEVDRATTAEGTLSTNIINESARAASVEEANRKLQAFIFNIEANKPSVNYDNTTKIKISDGQLAFVKDTKKWYTATTSSIQGASVTWTEFEMPGGGGGGGDVTQEELDAAVAAINATIDATKAELEEEIADAEYAAERTATLIATGEPPVTSIPANTYRGVTTSGVFPGTEFPYLYTHDVTDFNNMFNGSTGLTAITDLDTSNGTNFNGMFRNCTYLTSISDLDTSNGTNFKYMFMNCDSLTSIPNLDTSNGTNFNGMFAGCSALTSIPNLDTSNGTDFETMFTNCVALTSIPNLDTSNGTMFYNMFGNCPSLTSIPDLDTSNGTNLGCMFENCTSLTSIPDIDTSSSLSYNQIFNGCTNLTSIPDLNINANASIGRALFGGCTSLTTLRDNPYAPEGSRWQFKESISFNACPLDRASILKVFNGLATVSGQSITISSTTNGYLSADDKAIAENKGWTVMVI